MYVDMRTIPSQKTVICNGYEEIRSGSMAEVKIADILGVSIEQPKFRTQNKHKLTELVQKRTVRLCLFVCFCFQFILSGLVRISSY